MFAAFMMFMVVGVTFGGFLYYMTTKPLTILDYVLIFLASSSLSFVATMVWLVLIKILGV